ncbi:MAG: NAD(P)H-hydrate dehydratase, partial [Burkholderiales bacterium]|nr:NAD(P)H-hydrate dehydratase [Burkholderiales bacterium]
RRWWTGAPDILARTTVVCGCGGGAAVAGSLPPLIAHAARLVLDADALNAIADDATLQRLLAARAARALPTVITPHPLEAAHLLGAHAAAVQADRLGAARALVERFGVVAVLKGSGTIVAAPAALPSVNPTGNALLAAAGTGDVLAGWIGGVWAAGAGDARSAAIGAVWQHGHAADLAQARGRHGALAAGELVDWLRAL